MKNVFVTGHRGLVGSSLLRQIDTTKYNIITAEKEVLDLTNQYETNSFLHNQHPDIIIISAAKVGGIRHNMDNPVEFLYENSMIANNLIYGALKTGIKDIVYISCSCMYPKDYNNKLKEINILEAPLEPTNEASAIAKILGARLCEYCNREYTTNFKTIIPCNLYGPNDNYDPDKSHLMAAVIHKVHTAKLNNEPDIVIWGDGTARREFIYVDDLTNFISNSLDKLQEFPDYLNVGADTDISILDLYKLVAGILGYTGIFNFDMSSPKGMSSKLLDCSIAKGYEWEPSTDLTDGIRLTYNDYLERINSV